MDIMLDIETLGLKPGCVVLSIGAVRFDEDNVGMTFHRNIDIESCMDAGLTIDPETLEWWMDQDSEAQEVLTGGSPLEEVLEAFNDYAWPELMSGEGVIWANSPAFDCVILRAAYDAAGVEVPWHYSQERCCRTLMDLVPVEVEEVGTNHDARDDAMSQAMTAQKSLRKL